MVQWSVGGRPEEPPSFLQPSIPLSLDLSGGCNVTVLLFPLFFELFRVFVIKCVIVVGARGIIGGLRVLKNVVQV